MNAQSQITRAGTELEKVSFRDMLAGDVVQLALQPSQHVCLGVTRKVHSVEDGQELMAGGPAWTAIAPDGRILTCGGFHELWPANERTGGHAIAWALLAENLGPAHRAITAFAQRQVAESSYSRIEAIVRVNVRAELRWARLIGFGRPHFLRAWGPDGEPHILLERIRETGARDPTAAARSPSPSKLREE